MIEVPRPVVAIEDSVMRLNPIEASCSSNLVVATTPLVNETVKTVIQAAG
jgi:hypothetical protein